MFTVSCANLYSLHVSEDDAKDGAIHLLDSSLYNYKFGLAKPLLLKE